MSDLASSTNYGVDPTAANVTVVSIAANLARVDVDTVFDCYSQRRTSTELYRTPIEIQAAMDRAKVQLLDYIADRNS